LKNILKKNYKKILNINRIFRNISILRFGIIYRGLKKENWSSVEKIFDEVKKGSQLSIGSKKTSRKFVYLDDLINGILLSIKSKGYNVYNLTGDKRITLKKIVKISEKYFNKRIKILEKNPNHPSIRNIDSSKAKKYVRWKINMQFENYIKNWAKKNEK